MSDSYWEGKRDLTCTRWPEARMSARDQWSVRCSLAPFCLQKIMNDQATQRINNNLNTVANHHPLQPIPTWVIVSAPISTAARALCVNYAAAQPPLPPALWPRGHWPPESSSSLTPLCLLPTSVTTGHQHHADHQSLEESQSEYLWFAGWLDIRVPRVLCRCWSVIS